MKPSFDSAKNAASKRKLKGPMDLQLKYAKWQEQIGNLKEARESYEFVLGEEPKSAEAILGLARLDQLAGRHREAEQGFLKALKTYPKDAHVLHAAGQFYVAQEQWKEAVGLLNTAMKTAPADKTVRYHLAVALARSGDINSAKPHFVKSVGDAEAHYNIGLILYEQGKLESSEKQFLQAVIKKPELQQAQFWLDEVRREQEAGFILTGSSDMQSRYEELPPPNSEPTYPDNEQRHTTSVAQNENRIQNEYISSSDSRSLPHIAGAQQNDLAVGHSSPAPSTDRRHSSALPVISQSRSEPASHLTPAQLEQRRNQVRLSNRR